MKTGYVGKGLKTSDISYPKKVRPLRPNRNEQFGQSQNALSLFVENSFILSSQDAMKSRNISGFQVVNCPVFHHVQSLPNKTEEIYAKNADVCRSI